MTLYMPMVEETQAIYYTTSLLPMRPFLMFKTTNFGKRMRTEFPALSQHFMIFPCCSFSKNGKTPLLASFLLSCYAIPPVQWVSAELSLLVVRNICMVQEIFKPLWTIGYCSKVGNMPQIFKLSA